MKIFSAVFVIAVVEVPYFMNLITVLTNYNFDLTGLPLKILSTLAMLYVSQIS
jgi:hypothetical protein